MLRIFNLQTKHFLIIRQIKTIPSFVFNERDQIIPQGRNLLAFTKHMHQGLINFFTKMTKRRITSAYFSKKTKVQTWILLCSFNPNLTTGFTGLVGKVRKKLSPEGGRKGGWRKKSARSAPAGPGARTRNLPRARRGSPAARHGGCLDKPAFPCL